MKTPNNEARIKVLIVDDDPGILTVMSRVILAMGFDVARASSAQEAISEIDNADILLADLKLNGGIAGGELVLDTWLSRRSGPCCVLTGVADREKEIDLLIRGADNVIWKPVPTAAIQAVLNRYKRHIKSDRLRATLLHEINELKQEVADLKEVVKKSQKRHVMLTLALGIILAVVLGFDASGTTIADLISKLLSMI